MQLFCFTFAGGSASFFSKLEKYLDPEITVVKMEYAGHGSRHREGFYKNFTELADDMYSALLDSLNPKEPYILFGYSMGSIAVVELVKLILGKKEIPVPFHVFLASHAPMTDYRLGEIKDIEIDEKVKAYTISFGGLSEKLINNDSFWRIYLPVYRADYALIWKYDFGRLAFKTDIPATVFFSSTDIPRENIEKWRDIFINRCNIMEYCGGHFFIIGHMREIANIM